MLLLHTGFSLPLCSEAWAQWDLATLLCKRSRIYHLKRTYSQHLSLRVGEEELLVMSEVLPLMWDIDICHCKQNPLHIFITFFAAMARETLLSGFGYLAIALFY